MTFREYQSLEPGEVVYLDTEDLLVLVHHKTFKHKVVFEFLDFKYGHVISEEPYEYVSIPEL